MLFQVTAARTALSKVQDKTEYGLMKTTLILMFTFQFGVRSFVWGDKW